MDLIAQADLQTLPVLILNHLHPQLFNDTSLRRPSRIKGPCLPLRLLPQKLLQMLEHNTHLLFMPYRTLPTHHLRSLNGEALQSRHNQEILPQSLHCNHRNQVNHLHHSVPHHKLLKPRLQPRQNPLPPQVKARNPPPSGPGQQDLP